MFLSATSAHLLNTSRDSDSTTALGSLFQCLTTLSVKKFFLTSNLNLPWCHFLLSYHLLLGRRDTTASTIRRRYANPERRDGFRMDLSTPRPGTSTHSAAGFCSLAHSWLHSQHPGCAVGKQKHSLALYYFSKKTAAVFEQLLAVYTHCESVLIACVSEIVLHML